MLKKQKLPTSNNSDCVLKIVSGARKRRMAANAAIRSVNFESGNKNGLIMIK